MNIRTRLHISNIVMIVVAACIACLVGLACIASIWFVITGGAPFESEVMSAYLVSWGFSGFNIDVLKTTIITACLILLFVILVTVVITDQVMTRFVIRHITAPLDCLSAGVEEIRTGNLDYRINYQEPDEFKPVCDAFDEMAQRLASSVERDRRGEDARKELFSAMSHDLRSPLTSIRGYAEGLRDGVAQTTEDQKYYLEVILDKTNEMEEKISNLLAMTRLDNPDTEISIEPLKLNDFLSSYFDESLPEYAAQGMHITCKLSDLTVMANKDELRRILDIVLNNSLRYRIKDEVEVSVTLTQDGDNARLEIADNGPGVNPEDLSRIFDALYRGDSARSSRQRGSGLGLSIVAASVARMHGSVCAKNAETGGLVIMVTLPCARS